MPVPDTYKPSDTAPPSDNLKAADFKVGQKLRATIEDVELVEMKPREGEGGSPRKKLRLTFVGKEKGIVLNVENQTEMESALGYNPNEWIGAEVVISIKLVVFGDKKVNGFRIVDIKGAHPVEREPGEDDAPF